VTVFFSKRLYSQILLQ